jgi:hypothetical protein
MEEEQEEEECCNCDCCSKRTISFIIIFIIVIDSMSIIMNILYLSIINWKYVSLSLFILTIFSLFFICVVLGFDITILVLKRHLYKNNKKYIISKIFSLIILIINPLMFILNFLLAIFISIDLHIADYPEYGGRERNEEYIKAHPDKFGNVSSGEFVVAALCPSLCSIGQFICMFFSITLFRRVYYLPENIQKDVKVLTNANDQNEVIGYRKNLKMIKTDDRLYPNKENLPKDLKYAKERIFEEINNGGK